MKYYIIPCLVFCLWFTSKTEAQNFHGGAMLGFNASQVDGDTYSGFNRFGPMGGVFVYKKLSETFDIQLEIKYMSKGARKRTTEYDLTQYKSNLNYIEMPILLRFNYQQKFGLEAGLGFGYLFSDSEEDENGVLPSNGTTIFKPYELSSIVGFKYQFAQKFAVNIRYSYSILSIVEVPKVATPYFRLGRGVYNNLFTIGLYYTLGK